MVTIMKADVKAKWVQALRSGEYQQGDGVLRNGDKFCCLGVLCDLAVKDGVSVQVDIYNGYQMPGEVLTYDEQYELTPESVQEWAGLESSNPDVTIKNKDYYSNGDLHDVDPEEDFTSSLAELNDEGRTFDEIATWIENSL